VPDFEIYKNLFLFKFHRLGAPPLNNYLVFTTNLSIYY